MNDEHLTPRPSPFALDWPPLLHTVQPILAAQPHAVYLVGGAVRDVLLRRPVHDLDFVSIDDGRTVARHLANKLHGAYYPLDAERGVGRTILTIGEERHTIDIAQTRGATLYEDLLARDFTLNALAVPLDGDLQSIIDPLGGWGDIIKKILRRCSPTSISDDPIRALRGIRHSILFNLLIDPATRQDIRQDGQSIGRASMERIRDEFMNLLDGPRPHVGLKTLDALGLLSLIIPEVDNIRGVEQSPPHIFPVWEHTLAVIENLASVLHTISPQRTSDSVANTADGMIVYLLDKFRHPLQEHLAEQFANGRTVRSLLMLAALLHDVGKSHTGSVDENGRIHFYQHEFVGADTARQRAIALKLSNEEVTRLTAIVMHHMRPVSLNLSAGTTVQLSRRSVYRYWNNVGYAAGIDVCLLTLADHLGMVGHTLDLQTWIRHIQVVQGLLDGYFSQREQVVSPPTLVTGRDLMDILVMPPGPEIGRLLSAIQEAQASGEVETREQALQLARTLLSDTDNSPDQR